MRRALLLSVLMLSTALVGLSGNAAAAVTPGVTAGLVNSGQSVRDSSSAIPVFGFSATSSGGGDVLTSVAVRFGGSDWDGGDNEDILALNNNPGLSGVAVYVDSSNGPGSDDVLDAGDTPVTATGNAKSGGNTVFQLDYNDPVPASVVGSYHWFIVIRTADAPDRFRDGETFSLAVETNTIVFSGPIRQPGSTVTANLLTARPMRVADLSTGANRWIGGAAAMVRARAVLGLSVVDGGFASNGVNDVWDGVAVNFVQIAGYQADDYPALGTNPATSHIALYRDSNPNDVWDPADTGVTLAGAVWAGLCGGGSGSMALLDLPAEAVPDSPSGTYNFFVVARTNLPENGDQSAYRICRDQSWFDGILAADNDRASVIAEVTSSPLVADTVAPCFIGMGGGCPAGAAPAWSDPTGSPYVYPASSTNMYFSHQMPTPVPMRISGLARDDQSGLGNVTFSTEASLAGTPAAVQFSGQASQNIFFSGDYLADATSDGSSSPAALTLLDIVGNQFNPNNWNYFLDDEGPAIDPDPGWRFWGGGCPNNPPNCAFYINGNGVLYFSDWIAAPGMQQEIRADLSDSGGSGLRNISASAEASLQNGPSYQDTTNPGGNFFNDWEVRYGFDTASTDESSPVLLWLQDNVGNFDTATFDYAEDNDEPDVSITWPMAGDVLSGRVIIAATSADAKTAIDHVELWMDGALRGTMFFNGSHYLWPLQTGLFSDGTHVFQARAVDEVNNDAVAVVQVSFANTPPDVMLTGPANMDVVRGLVRVTAETSNGARVSRMELTIGSASAVPMIYDPVLNRYWHDWNTSSVNGTQSVPLTVRGFSGGQAGPSDTVNVMVDNTAPAVSVVSPKAGAEVSGMRTVQIQVMEDLEVARVTISIGGAAGGPATYNPTTGMYEYAWSTGALSDGTVDLAASAWDTAGNKGTGTAAGVLVDNSAPSLLVTSPADRAVITGKTPLSISSSDAGSGFDGPGEVAARVDSGPWMHAAGGPADWTVEIDSSIYADGEHAVEVRSTDDAGNMAEASLRLTTDSTPPLVSLLFPAASSWAKGTVRVEVSALDTIGVKGVMLKAGAKDQAMAKDPDTGRWVAMVDTKAQADGDLALAATATDMAGLTSTSNSTVKVDNSGPQIALARPDSNKGWIMLLATVTDASGVESVQAVVDGKTYDMVPTGTANQYRLSIYTTIADNGQHAYEVRAKDSLGNAASARDTYDVANPVDYWKALLDATPFLLFMLLLFGIILFLMLMRSGKLGAWWHRYESAKEKEDEPEPIKEEKPVVKEEPKSVPSSPAAAVAAAGEKKPEEIEKDERS